MRAVVGHVVFGLDVVDEPNFGDRTIRSITFELLANTETDWSDFTRYNERAFPPRLTRTDLVT